MIDPVLDYDHRTGKASTQVGRRHPGRSGRNRLTIEWVLETHAHADHLSGAPYVKLKTGAKVGIGEHIREVQKIFRPVFNATDVSGDGSEFDHLFKDGERFKIGSLEVEVSTRLATRRPTSPTRSSDAVFVGDTLFMPDYGTARADFPGGDARSSTARSSACWRCRPRRGCSCAMTTRRRAAITMPGRRRSASSAPRNVHVQGRRREDEFVAMREARDAKLCGAAAPAAVDPGQHPRRQISASRGQRRALPESAGQALSLGGRARTLPIVNDLLITGSPVWE